MYRIVCSMFIVLAICVSGVLADEHLIFYATFDEDLDDVVKDHSHYANDGEFMNGAKRSPDGKYGSCAEIRGNLAHVNIPHDDLFVITETLTMEAWVNPDVIPQQGMLIQKCGNYCLWFMNNGQVRVADDVGEKLDTVGEDFNSGEWYHIAGILDTETPRHQIYVNGELSVEDKAPFDMVPTNDPLQCGHKWTAPGSYQYTGLIDEVRLWNVVRTADEIKQDMETSGGEAVFPRSKLTSTWGRLKMKS